MVAKYLLIITFFSSLVFAKEPIIVASKSFSESIIIAEMVSILLEKKYNISVVRKMGLGGTKVAFDALKNDDIHIYPDYTGTGYVMILKLFLKDPKWILQKQNVYHHPLQQDHRYC